MISCCQAAVWWMMVRWKDPLVSFIFQYKGFKNLLIPYERKANKLLSITFIIVSSYISITTSLHWCHFVNFITSLQYWFHFIHNLLNSQFGSSFFLVLNYIFHHFTFSLEKNGNHIFTSRSSELKLFLRVHAWKKK